MKRKTLILAALALVLVLGAGIGSTMAFFTTYTEVQGGYTAQLEMETVESLSDWTKHLSIANNSNSQPVFVRARAVAGDTYALTYSGGDGWSDGGDGWWYYDSVVDAGESTPVLDIHIGNVPENVKDGTSFNVIVYTECTPVLYEDGQPTADWDNIVARNEQRGGTIQQGGNDK